MTASRRVEPVLSEEELARAASILVGLLGLLGLIGLGLVEIISPGDLPRTYHATPVLALSAVSLVAAGFLPRFPWLLRSRWNAVALAVAALGIAAVSWAAGPSFSAYPAMSFLWVGMAAQLLLSRARAFAIVGLVGALYGAQVAFQAGNSGPVTRWILVVGAVLVAGVVVGAVGDHIDHLRESEHGLRLQVEEATLHLEEAARQRREFLAGMSHELRTPLNAIIGFADVISEELFGPLSPAQRPLVDGIRAAGDRLLALVREVLDLDPVAPPAPPAVPPAPPDHASLIGADPKGALAFFLLLPVALLTLPRTPAHFDLGAIILLAAVGVAVDMAVLLTDVLPLRARAAAHLGVVTVVVAAIALAAGGELSPFATMFFTWMATAATIRLPRRAAIVQVAAISALEALIVTVQPGNPAAAWRWAATTGTVIASAIVIRLVVDRLFEAADLEATMRWAADETRSALEATNQHKVDFLRNVRQELRWPVDEVIAAARALLDGSRGVLDPRQAEYAADIVGASEQLWSLITDILDLATLESGGMTLRVDVVVVADLLHDAVGAFAVDAVDVEPPGARVWTDRDKLRRAVGGLVSNAVKFTPHGGRVAVRAVVADQRMVITVADTGRGIPAEDQARIFEGFQQGGSAMVAPGMGLGLTLARRFVELQGGRLELVSEPGIGSTFTITLPVFERPMLEGAPVA